MKRMRTQHAAWALAVVLLAACEGRGVGPGEPSWFQASLEGALQVSFQGTGDFAPLRDGDGDRTRYFMIFSESTSPDVRDAVYLRWPTAARPAPGRYPLVAHDHPRGSSHGVAALYHYGRGDNVSQPAVDETYVAQSGWVEITRSSRGVMEGRVSFTAAQVFKRTGMTLQRNDLRETPAAGAPRIQVTGSFHAVFFDEEAQVGIPN